MKKAPLAAVMFLMTTSTAVAFADELPAPPPAPPTETPAPTDPAGTSTDTSAASTQTPPPEEKPKTDQGGRVRWGVSPSLGWHLPQSMFTIGGEGHVGYQISNPLSVYGALGGVAGFGFGGDVGVQGVSVSVSAVSYWYLGAIAEYMLADLFYFGGGPVLARGAIAGVTVGADASGVAEVTQMVSAGFKPGLNLRFGLGFGKAKAGSFRRGGFNLGVDAMMLFHPSAVFVKTRADGPNGEAGTSVSTSEVGVTLVPMLTLGYDSR